MQFYDTDSCKLQFRWPWLLPGTFFSSPTEYYLHKTWMLFEFVTCDTSPNVHRQHGSPQGAACPSESWSRGLALHFGHCLGQWQHQRSFSIAPLPRPLTFGLLGAGGARNHKLMSVMKWDRRWLKLTQCYWSECPVCSGFFFLFSEWDTCSKILTGEAGFGIVNRPSLPWLKCLFLLLSKTGKHAFRCIFSSYMTFKINTKSPNVSINSPVL